MTTRMIADRLVDRPANTPPSQPATSGQKCTVACALPMGAILDVYRIEEYSEPSPTGAAQRAKRAVPIEEKRIVLRGWAQPGTPAGTVSPTGTASGFGLTFGVDRETFDTWLRDNAQSPLVKNRIIFAAGTEDRARDEARELEAVRSGLEPIEPGAPGERVPDKRIGRDRLAVSTFNRDKR
jgi:hypothetical protein